MHVESWGKVVVGTLIGLVAVGWWIERGGEPVVPLMIGAVGLFVVQEGVVFVDSTSDDEP